MLRKKKYIFISILLFLFILYWVICYFLVSLALVPSFMERTSVFDSVTEASVEALVQTSDIQENHAQLLAQTREWLETASMEKHQMTSSDGYELIAASFAPEESSNKWVLLLHGYTGWKEELYPLAMEYTAQGYHALVPDLRCSGESQGDFIGMGWTDRLDNLLWLDFILSQDPQAEIVIHGQSMGAACALMMAGKELPDQVSAIISDCAYTDAYNMFAREMKEWFSLPSFPLLDSMNLMLQLRGGYDLKEASALDAVSKTGLPILFIHGDTDDMVPVSMAYELYDATQSSKDIMIVEGAGHAQSMDKDPEAYFQKVFEFLETTSQ